MNTTVLWFRQDLRLDDHEGVLAAAARGRVLPVFILDDEAEARWVPGGASRWWLHRSLAALGSALAAKGAPLVLQKGETLQALVSLCRGVGADRVVASRRFEPAAIAQEARVAEGLRAAGIELHLHQTALLFAPESIRSGSGEPYKVFTPYWKNCLKSDAVEAPRDAPERLRAPDSSPKGVSLSTLGLAPTIAWDGGLAEMWTPGENGAVARLDAFARAAVRGYGEGRDRPETVGTSLLSPHLHFGEISPRRIWHRINKGGRTPDAEKFLAEIGWREFAHHVLAAFPRTPERPLRTEFEAFPWRRDAKALRAWQRGETGYPMVDAGMRQLWHTGWMHNRVRMIVASFLVKHLLLPWREGAAWFWDTLVDADLANNTLGWQWSGGCGADAAPYFRIFNPVLQGEKFDPDGAYVRRWVPELAAVGKKFIHRPWEAPPESLRAAGVSLGRSYPKPIVEHAMARARALEALAAISGSRKASPRS